MQSFAPREKASLTSSLLHFTQSTNSLKLPLFREVSDSSWLRKAMPYVMRNLEQSTEQVKRILYNSSDSLVAIRNLLATLCL
ncbi:zinc finger MYM-type protein [Trifolium repens]|nr:zinc finger MYM-type protein [Trifolium repens]